MKYTGIGLCCTVILVAALAAAAQTSLHAPASSFVASAPSVSIGASAAASSTGTDSDPDSVLTIKKRVNEVNVLFIATDKHGKFVRNLNQNDFAILDDHKPPES